MNDEYSSSSLSSFQPYYHHSQLFHSIEVIDATNLTLTRSFSSDSLPRIFSNSPRASDFNNNNALHQYPPPSNPAMSVASSRFSRFSLSRDDESIRAPSPFPENNGRSKTPRSSYVGSDFSISNNTTNTHNNTSISNNNSTGSGNINGFNKLTDNHDSSLMLNKRIINIPTTIQKATAALSPSTGAAAAVTSSSTPKIPNSTVLEAQQKASNDESDEALLELNQTLLEAILHNDFENYSALCADDIVCIEPESQGHLVRGIAFHRYFFEKASPELRQDVNVVMTNAHVRRLHDSAAVISYTRLNQRLDREGKPSVTSCNETRVWQKKEDGFWWNVHLHRS